jgi:hypothetical protein
MRKSFALLSKAFESHLPQLFLSGIDPDPEAYFCIDKILIKMPPFKRTFSTEDIFCPCVLKYGDSHFFVCLFYIMTLVSLFHTGMIFSMLAHYSSNSSQSFEIFLCQLV